MDEFTHYIIILQTRIQELEKLLAAARAIRTPVQPSHPQPPANQERSKPHLVIPTSMQHDLSLRKDT